jgi:hypothetical protein
MKELKIKISDELYEKLINWTHDFSENEGVMSIKDMDVIDLMATCLLYDSLILGDYENRPNLYIHIDDQGIIQLD